MIAMVTNHKSHKGQVVVSRTSPPLYNPMKVSDTTQCTVNNKHTCTHVHMHMGYRVIEIMAVILFWWIGSFHDRGLPEQYPPISLHKADFLQLELCEYSLITSNSHFY